MKCQAVDEWSLPLLVGAFLDLAIAYLLLCAAGAAYCACRFLAIFGLRLRCPCDGLFGHPKSGRCVWMELSEQPIEKVGSVRASVKGKFPFGTITVTGQKGEVEDGNGCAGSEGGASFGSYTGVRGQVVANVVGNADEGFGASFGRVSSDVVKYKQFAVKGRRVRSLRPRSGLSRHGKGFVQPDNSSFSSNDPQIAKTQVVCSPLSLNKSLSSDTEIAEKSPSYFSFRTDDASDGRAILVENHSDERLRSSFGKAVDGFSLSEKSGLNSEDLATVGVGDGNSCQFDEESVGELELVVKAECAGCASLCLEIEKERNAAATAADEAMAMIMRLQKEKASVEMEAKQYRRMIEEKSRFDAEEMNILREILLRREKEKHFLEKEVEAYQRIVLANEQWESGLLENTGTQKPIIPSSNVGDDPTVMIPDICQDLSRRDWEDTFTSSGHDITSVELENCGVDVEKENSFKEWYVDMNTVTANVLCRNPRINGSNHDVEEKAVISHDRTLSTGHGGLLNSNKPSSVPCKLDLHAESIGPTERQGEQNGNGSLGYVFPEDTKDTHSSSTHKISFNGTGLRMEPYIHDVHIVGDVPGSNNRKSDGKDSLSTMDSCSNLHRNWNELMVEEAGSRLDTSRRNSDLPSKTPAICAFQGQSTVSNLRRNSMSALDYERLKIDNEVGRLTERLKVVQEGRQRLKFCSRRWGSNDTGLQLSGNMGTQLEDIGQLREPGNSEHSGRLPPLSSEVVSKERCWRSVSLGVRRSTG